MLKKFWKNIIVDRGVVPGLEFNIRNKIRIFNSSIFIIGLIYLFYTVVGFLKGDNLAGALTLLAYIFTASCLPMMSMKKYSLAYHTSAITGIIFLFLFSVLYGETTQTQIFLIFIPIGATILFDNMVTIFYYFIITIICIAVLKLSFIFNSSLPIKLPYYPVQSINVYLGTMNIILTSALIYLCVRLFKQENMIYSNEIAHQKDVIEEKNKDILSSIHYAKRIQRALLASDTLLNENLPEHFVLYKPKDIVSGDFYWAEKLENRFMLAVCDCTGHGVPGAFMSLLNISFLNEIVNERKINRPDAVFNQLREDIIKVLNPKGASGDEKDGMDAVICSFDFTNNQIEFACANNPLWIFRNGEMLEFKPDKQPIGLHEGEKRNFTLQTVSLMKNDVIYIFTDGFADQFGGPKGKKFKYSQLKEKLISLTTHSLSEQKEQLDFTFENWRGNLEQVDDVLLFAIKI